jgi:Na+/H+ antiporter NhaD/arsenite permease-like protein
VTGLAWEQVATLGVALLTLLGVAFGRLPWVRLDRSGITLLGVALLLLSGVLSLSEAWALIDGDIILLLLGLMIVNGVLTQAGFFEVLLQVAVRRARSTLGLLAALVFASGILSAFFLNDTIVLMLTPLVLAVTRALSRPSVPYLLGLALAANVGSAAAITGNPQNLIVGVRSGIGFLPFLLALAPVALVGLGVVVLVLYLTYPREFRGVALVGRVEVGRVDMGRVDARPALDRTLLAGSVVVSAGMLLAFVVGVDVPAAALVAAALLLLLSRRSSDAFLQGVDWTLLVLFAGLFIVVGALEHAGVSEWLFAGLAPYLAEGLGGFALLTLLLSNLLSNVPAVLLLAPLVEGLGSQPRDWLALAMVSTFAGNLTLLGSVANLIVVEGARRAGVVVGFWDYLRVGVPVTALTILLGLAWLAYGPV